MVDLVFKDRQEAGRLLAERLVHLKEQNPLVLGLPRGGMPVAAAIADRLGAPLDVLMVRKIGAPGQPELAIGAVVGGDAPQLTLNHMIVEAMGISDAFLKQEMQKKLAELAERRALYCGQQPPLPVTGRTVIVVDDGIATGATARAAIMGLKQAHAKYIVLAVPVAPPNTVKALTQSVVELICLSQPPDFVAVGLCYADFHQISDNEVAALLKVGKQTQT